MKLKNRKISLIALSLMGSVLVTSLEGADAMIGMTDLIIKNRPATGVGTAENLTHSINSYPQVAKSSNHTAMGILEKYGEKTEKKSEVRISGEELLKALSEINKISPNALIIIRTASETASVSNDILW